MGTSRSVDEFFVKWERLKDGVQKDGPETVGAIAQFMKVRTLELAADEVGSDLRFSNNKRRPLGVRYDVRKGQNAAQAEVRAKGPFSWLEYGVAPHPIIPGARNKRFRGLAGIGLGAAAGPALPVQALLGTSAVRGKNKGKVLSFASGQFRRYALKAGGLPEKRTWSEGVEQTSQSAGEIADRQMVRTLTDVFR